MVDLNPDVSRRAGIAFSLRKMAVEPLYEPCDADFERLYRDYAHRVYRYALAVLRNPADAEDVTQTTFLNAFRAMRGGTEPELPEHWLLRIAHNTCRTRFLRAARRPQEVPFDESVQHLAVPDDEKPNLDEVLRALSRLPFNQRSALVMRELEGRSYEEIANALDVSVSSVEALLFRARRSLRVRRRALRVLGIVQLPPSLETLFGGGAATTGGAVVGGGALLKLATFFAAALTAGGAGYEAVQAYSAKPRVVYAAHAQTAAGHGNAAAAVSRSNGAVALTRGVPTGAVASRVRGARAFQPVAGPPAATGTSIPTAPGGAEPAGQPSSPSEPGAPAPAAPAPTAPVPAVPSAPTLPLSPPALPSTPQLPPPPVAVPTLPPPPALPAVPTLPPPPALPPPPDVPKLP
jgi:RNA polymerase sigma factor (sigma-70 family)